jgi:putative chitinase
MRFNHTTFFNGYRDVYGKLSQGQLSGLDNLLGYVELDADLTDVRWAAYMLATVKHECADTFQPITERGAKSYFDKYETGTALGKRLGNTAAGDGYLFRGRGYVQITGRANYERMSKGLALSGDEDLVLHPESALHPDVAYRIMSYGMRMGRFSGKKLGDYIAGNQCDYKNARRIINGVDQAEKIKDYAVNLEAVLNNSLVAA